MTSNSVLKIPSSFELRIRAVPWSSLIPVFEVNWGIARSLSEEKSQM